MQHTLITGQMKNKITPTDREIVMRDQDFIVSKTDPTGRITYCNRIFMKIAGYREDQLLNLQHNIIRHPDMPRAVFQLLWDTLKSGNEFFGYVKNLTHDGSFYWVFANVSPSYSDNGELLGYFSVRRKPDPKKIPEIAAVYREMLAEEGRTGAKNAISASTQVLNEIVKKTGKDYREFILSF
jgi:PAS domain S-box-containing protein